MGWENHLLLIWCAIASDIYGSVIIPALPDTMVTPSKIMLRVNHLKLKAGISKTCISTGIKIYGRFQKKAISTNTTTKNRISPSKAGVLIHSEMRNGFHLSNLPRIRYYCNLLVRI